MIAIDNEVARLDHDSGGKDNESMAFTRKTYTRFSRVTIQVQIMDGKSNATRGSYSTKPKGLYSM